MGGNPRSTVGTATDPNAMLRVLWSRLGNLQGFSLHADVAVPARRRDQLEKLCRYIVRPPLALERLTESTEGSCCTSSAGRGATGRRRSS